MVDIGRSISPLAFLLDRPVAPPPARSRSAGGRAVAFAIISGVAGASQELDVVGDHVNLGALGAVLGLPGPVLQPTLHQDRVALLLVVGHCLAELAPRTDVEEVHLLVPGANPVYGDTERAYRHARLGEAHLGVASEVAPEDHAVEADHEYLP